MLASVSDFGGTTALAFESRRADELGNLIRRQGGVPVVVPSMREVPLEENPAAMDFLGRLERGEIDVVIMLTGVGVRMFARTVAEVCPPAQLAELLGRTTLVVRGPKPAAALRELGLSAITVPEPNTWREVLAVLDATVPVDGRLVAVQEYGKRNAALIDGLESRRATVLSVPVYVWALPEDVRPLEEAVRSLAGDPGRFDFMLFTSATQVEHVLQIADTLDLREAVLATADRVVVASIGPICSEALREHGLPVDLEPDHPKMGSLVVALARRGPALVERKRAKAASRRP